MEKLYTIQEVLQVENKGKLFRFEDEEVDKEIYEVVVTTDVFGEDFIDLVAVGETDNAEDGDFVEDIVRLSVIVFGKFKEVI